MRKEASGIKTLMVNGSLALAILLLVIIAAYSVVFLARGMPFNTVSETSGRESGQIVQEIVYHPYPAAAAPLLASLVCLLGLLIRKYVLAWFGLAVLLIFSLLFLFSSGAALLPVAGVLLVLLTILQFNQRGEQDSSFLFLAIVLLVGLVVAGYYYLPALTPGQAARHFTWDMLFQDRPISRTVALEQDTAVVLSARLVDPERVGINYAVVERQGWGWRTFTGGGLTTGRYSGDPAVMETVGAERGLPRQFIYGYLLTADIKVIEATLSNGESLQDRTENELFLIPMDDRILPCRLTFWGEIEGQSVSIDLTNPAQRRALPDEMLANARRLCPEQ